MALQFKEGTISDYDLILSVSQEAINSQLKKLYNYQINTDDENPEHAINHDWTIQVETKKDKNNPGQRIIDPEVGLFAHIDCPSIDLAEGGAALDTTKMTIRFKQGTKITKPEGENVPDSYDSLLYYWDGNGRDATIESQNLNDWTVSWRTYLRQEKIPDFMKDLVHAHDNPESPTYLPPGLYGHLNSLDPRIFTVSSIFSLFEDALFMDTFDITNDKGAPPSNPDLVWAIMDHIKAYYSGLKNLDINPAIPSPNTFVLGYGLFQTNLQNLGQIKTGVSWEKTPAYLIPATFALTSSQAKEQPEGGVNRNTLNFCMMTHRSKDSTNDQIRTINPSDKNAGTLNRNFFDLTKATNPDGIMCWSSHLFWERWVREEIVPTLWIDPTPIISEINSKVASRPITVSVWNDSVASKTPFMQRKLSFETGREWQGQSGRYLTVKGFSNITVEASSDFKNKGIALPTDARRRAYIVANIDFKLVCTFERDNTRKEVNAKYEEVYFVWFIVKHKIVLALEPGAAGTWSATCDATQTQPVDIATALNSPGFDTSDYLKWRKGIQNPDTAGPGAFVKYHAFMADATESAEYVSNTVPSAIEAVNSGITTLMQRLDAAMAGLNTSVMMPGGEVMTFSGMDTDDEGRLYAHIKYAVAPDDVTPITS